MCAVVSSRLNCRKHFGLLMSAGVCNFILLSLQMGTLLNIEYIWKTFSWFQTKRAAWPLWSRFGRGTNQSLEQTAIYLWHHSCKVPVWSYSHRGPDGGKGVPLLYSNNGQRQVRRRQYIFESENITFWSTVCLSVLFHWDRVYTWFEYKVFLSFTYFCYVIYLLKSWFRIWNIINKLRRICSLGGCKS